MKQPFKYENLDFSSFFIILLHYFDWLPVKEGNKMQSKDGTNYSKREESYLAKVLIFLKYSINFICWKNETKYLFYWNFMMLEAESHILQKRTSYSHPINMSNIWRLPPSCTRRQIAFRSYSIGVHVSPYLETAMWRHNA